MDEVRHTVILLSAVLVAFLILTKYKKIKKYIKWLINEDD